MIKRSKIYSKREPEREGKLYFIFCEGERKETTYFYFFNRIASQIIIQIVPIAEGKNSPMGLYQNARQCLIKSEENPNPTYEFHEGDEIWFIIDTDKWGEQISELRNSIVKHDNWFTGQSNPCFEVWLYYHFEGDKPKEVIQNWKDFLNSIIKGGFDVRKHPVFIQTAIINSEKNFVMSADQPHELSTEVFALAKKILPLVKSQIDELLQNQL